MHSSGEHREKPFILMTWFQPRNKEDTLWWCWVQYLPIDYGIDLRGVITGNHYWNILADHLHLMLQTVFPGERFMFQDTNDSVHISRCVQTWLQEHDGKVEHLTWCPQSLISLSLCGIFLENKVHAWFSLSHALSQDGPVWVNGCEFWWTLFKTFICQSHI